MLILLNLVIQTNLAAHQVRLAQALLVTGRLRKGIVEESARHAIRRTEDYPPLLVTKLKKMHMLSWRLKDTNNSRTNTNNTKT